MATVVLFSSWINVRRRRRRCRTAPRTRQTGQPTVAEAAGRPPWCGSDYIIYIIIIIEMMCETVAVSGHARSESEISVHPATQPL